MPARRDLLAAGVALPLVAAYPARAGLVRHQGVRVAAPFDMPAIEMPDFGAVRGFPITEYGAAPADQQANQRAIADSIAAASATGGGRVVVPAGIWATGPIHLRSNVELHLEKGATLAFSPDPGDYLPAVPTSWEGIECLNYSPLIYAYDCDNVAITGEGTLLARLDTWAIWYNRPKPHMDALVDLYQNARKGVPVDQRDMTRGAANLRPHFIQLNRCRHVLIEGVRIQGSPFWTIHPYLCRDVVIRGVDIVAHGHNNDGVDPEMSQNVLIENCVFDQGDDAVSVKSGRDHDGWRLHTPARNVVVRNCRMKNGHQLMAIGSEVSGGIENVFVDNCHFDPQGSTAESSIQNILFVKTNERRGGFVRNIHLSNVSATKVAGGVLSVDTDVLYQWRTLTPTYDRRLTTIEGLHVTDVRVAEASFVCAIKGQAELPVRNVLLRDVRVERTTGTAMRTTHVTGLRVENEIVNR
ncbi:glycoside hydrolase family 28 protein [Sphingomonas psychrotolerans]|uniref:Glycoside hydrolase family 28 protein n=1 Tax=Sphingomonas psychrotolerans TaxID=1327635 RepID=A0ABU3NAZ6_9SPHN|nr:glycoside hydrolase family 28 protein [Sphingomonas psychrotolerans]MDT8761079.1 glycoside hydrolase family 28 protein [Sphingomonas psychrotolerans]